MHSRGTMLTALLTVLSLIIFIKVPITTKSAPTVCFLPAYRASFDTGFSISPSGSFSTQGSTISIISGGFRNGCVNISVSSGGTATLSTKLNVKGSFKTSFMMKISDDVNFSFASLGLKLADSTDYFKIVLGRRDGKIIVSKGGDVTRGANLEYGKWCNITISIDVSRDYLAVSCNGSLIISFSTGISVHKLVQVLLEIGVINPSGDVKVCFDEFSMLVSPIVFTDKPVYTSSANVQVNLSGDQFPSQNLEVDIIRPDGSIAKRDSVPLSQVNDSRISGFYGFSYSISLSNPPPGTYTIRVSGSGFKVEYHFGVWNAPSVWERKSTVNIKAGGFEPNSFVTIYVRNQTRTLLSQKFKADDNGKIDQNIIVPVDLALGSLKVLLTYDGTYDFSRMSGSTGSISINVVKAVLNITIVTDANTYERVDQINVRVYAKYRDGSILPLNSLIKLYFIYNNVEKKTTYMSYNYDGYWSKTIELKPSDEYGDYLILIEASDPYGNSGTKNKTITVTTARLLIDLISQLEESYERSTRLNLSVSVKYKGGAPVESGRVTLEMIKDNKKSGPFSFTKTDVGEWVISRKIPMSEHTGRWELKIIAVDDYGNTGDLSLSVLIVPAELIVQPLELFNRSFSRTQSIPLSITVKYPSHEILQEENGIVNASLIHLEKGIVSSVLLKFFAGSWRGNLTVPKNAPLGEHVLRISAEDHYGNSGFLNNTVEVTKAVLSMRIIDLRDEYQIGFDTIRLKCIVKYLDGSIMNEGNVTAVLSSDSMTATVVLKYSDGAWVGEYGLPLTTSTGEYRVSINAEDPYGNTGVGESTFRVSNVYIIIIVVSVAIALGVTVSILVLRRRETRVLTTPFAEDYGVFG
ncbi:MAG: hypothetical protein FGF52_03985 [Candidatus Brockarchaeota archaeon]|nr:hypothetical protein [Candidatus Brockarchaeota archaeon]